jgi:hypothetical protein
VIKDVFLVFFLVVKWDNTWERESTACRHFPTRVSFFGSEEKEVETESKAPPTTSTKNVQRKEAR